MTTVRPEFTPVEASLYLTLCGRALGNRSPHPFLGDDRADGVVRAVGYDCSQLPLATFLHNRF